MQLSLGIILSTLVFFVWSAISWMALPWQRTVFSNFKEEERMRAVLDEQAPGSGIYGLPGEPVYPPDASKEQRDQIDQAAFEKLQRGPVVFAVISRGSFGTYPAIILRALIGNLIVSALFAWMLLQTSGLPYWERVAFLVVGSIAAGIACRIPDWNWHRFPMNYTLIAMANLTVGWILAGLVLASFVRGKA